ncbi:conjugal transfer protein TraC [Salmonella enterica]|nr:hypothetical protein [Salmonella enterica subsp. enterica serovar Chester]EAP0132036.1 hypothetical protein [Salmonella enterica]EBH3085931.1 DUF2913 family protein [Salmonella enterica subsp. enterica serovar Poona]EBZ2757406.1 DUF2913 family protein [Salmonella enterica subsp. enterica serovar Pomona]ECB7314543.1 DUF2913 family protein [Salmonella enterica subsp. enterica serovar Treforest]EDQ6122720.1 DUF2913 family protein [Salmonella enterica subsp. enterica serovar Richmond]EDZ986628
MKKAHDTLPPEQTVAALAHFAWCALVALRTAQQDGQALSPLSMHAFLLRWLTVAYKQKRFTRAIASDIEALLTLGRNKGLAASLFSRLEYLWVSCTGPVIAQSDLYRLTYAIEQLKSEGWVNAVVSDREWGTEALTEEYRDIDALLVRKSALTDGFSNEGKLVALVEFQVTGNLSACMAVFLAHALPAVVLKPDRIAIQL